MSINTEMIDWHYPRKDLATRYMDAFSTGITGALALFAPRRMGKSEFCLLDLAPEAEARGYSVGYCSFWNLKDNPAKGLRIALEDISKQGKWRSKWASYVSEASTEVSASFAGAGFSVKNQSSGQEEDDLVAVIEILGKLARKRNKTLIILDEVQHLADDRYSALVAMLRTQFDQHRNKLHVVYTGSSRDGLQRMFRDRRTPMFHAAQQVDFPSLGSVFVSFMLSAFKKASKRGLSLPSGIRVFERLGHNPSLFHQLLRHMVIAGIWDIDEGFEHFNMLIDVDADYKNLWDGSKPVDQHLLLYLAHDRDEGIYSTGFLDETAEALGLESLSIKAMQMGIKRLRENQVLYSVGRGAWVFEDPKFKHWILENIPND